MSYSKRGFRYQTESMDELTDFIITGGMYYHMLFESMLSKDRLENPIVSGKPKEKKYDLGNFAEDVEEIKD